MSDIKTLDCGCEVIVATNGSVMLTYCPLHKAASDLYEACKIALDKLSETSAMADRIKARKIIKQALAKAEVK